MNDKLGVASAFESPNPRRATDAGGGGAPTGVQACARAILNDTDSDDKWAASVNLWDKTRAAIRKLPRDAEVAAWQLAYDALTELRADLEQQFGIKIGGGVR